MRIAALAVIAIAVSSACTAEVGSRAWCDKAGKYNAQELSQLTEQEQDALIKCVADAIEARS
ncbi:MAG: hypothetical protein Q8R02_19675 [Hyphomonadaceae bacterium]|nr:hypothetical protein [Hyphomonadaceae bacterium]